jgi:glycosyltransferase involved in cell wall biosynthesis
LVSAIIPARNEEASIAQAVETVAAQAEVGEVIVVNDESTDGTGAILAKLGARIPKLKVLETGELPAGWVGKNYAASMGAGAAQGDWLLFTDADTYHYPGSTRRALADAAENHAALVSYSPEQEMETFWERALIPVVYWRLAKKYSYEDINDEESPNAAANGQYLLVRRDVYRAVGGHGAVANEILEDVALARRVKQAGHRIYFATGRGIVRTRMYRSFRAMWEGWTKNLHPLMTGSTPILIGDFTVWLGLAGIAILVAGGYLQRLGPMMLLGGGVFIAGMLADYALDLRGNRYPLYYIEYFVPGVCLYFAARMASWWKTTRGSVNWKGRAYQARTP